MIEPPLAARLYFTHDGLASARYQPLMGGSAGIRNTTPTSPTRWCPQAKDVVPQDACAGCPAWADDGGGSPACALEAKANEDDDEDTTQKE
jgi:hypothetical protein